MENIQEGISKKTTISKMAANVYDILFFIGKERKHDSKTELFKILKIFVVFRTFYQVCSMAIYTSNDKRDTEHINYFNICKSLCYHLFT